MDQDGVTWIMAAYPGSELCDLDHDGVTGLGQGGVAWIMEVLPGSVLLWPGSEPCNLASTYDF